MVLAKQQQPHPSLRLTEFPVGLASATRDFFLQPTERVARDLIGAWFLRHKAGEVFGARIVEVEAYLGTHDAASHSYHGRRTARVEPMYLVGGHFYVFMVYGMHCCLNLVTQEAEKPEAVLIRAAEPPPGGNPKLLAGPAKFCKGFGINLQHSSVDLITDPRFDLYPDPQPAHLIATTSRIGVEYAGEAAKWEQRYYLRNSPSVNRKG